MHSASGTSFDPVLIHDMDDAEVVGLTGYSVGELRLIFRPASLRRNPNQPTKFPQSLAYVLSFSDIKLNQLDPNCKLLQVYKLYNARQERVGRVIDLASIVRPCPLSPKHEGMAHIFTDPYTSLELYQEFFINPFMTHSDYRSLRVA
ncbi:hypothetical protein FRB90_003500 [Tulasnella sp. 427]|nr:hypothetical protein FRB90_003500 [Tulasnella sp. 427]